MELYRDKEFEDEIVAKIVSNWGNNEREDIHLSDLISPRKAYFNKKLKLPPTKDDIFTFLVGLGIEDKLGALMGDKHARTEIRHGIYFSQTLGYRTLPNLNQDVEAWQKRAMSTISMVIILDNSEGTWLSRKNGPVTYSCSLLRSDLTRAEKRNLNLQLTDCGVPKTSLPVIWKIYSMLKTDCLKPLKVRILQDYPCVKIGFVVEVLNHAQFNHDVLPAIGILATTIFLNDTRRVNELLTMR